MTPTQAADGEGFVRLSAFTVEDLAWLIGVLEDWLLHASDDTSADLAAFAGNGPFSRPADQHARLIANQLGDHHVTLLHALAATGHEH